MDCWYSTMCSPTLTLTFPVLFRWSNKASKKCLQRKSWWCECSSGAGQEGVHLVLAGSAAAVQAGPLWLCSAGHRVCAAILGQEEASQPNHEWWRGKWQSALLSVEILLVFFYYWQIIDFVDDCLCGFCWHFLVICLSIANSADSRLFQITLQWHAELYQHFYIWWHQFKWLLKLTCVAYTQC